MEYAVVEATALLLFSTRLLWNISAIPRSLLYNINKLDSINTLLQYKFQDVGFRMELVLWVG